VLLATSLVHLLPEIRETLEPLGVEIESLAEILLCCGFFMIYFVEEVAYMIQGEVAPNEKQDNIMANGGNPSETRRLSIAKASEVKQHLEEHRESLAMAALPSGGSSTSTAIRDFCTVLALSFHAVFEGLAVGLEESTEDVWTLFAAVAAHKFVISFTVGIELVSVGTPMPFFLTYIITYAVMTPIGIGIGIAVTELADSDNIAYAAATGTLQALAAGCIIYVVVFEILQRERSKVVKPKIAQFFALVVGFATMMTVDLTLHHDHHEEEV